MEEIELLTVVCLFARAERNNPNLGEGRALLYESGIANCVYRASLRSRTFRTPATTGIWHLTLILSYA